MIICPYCAGENPDNAIQCSHCDKFVVRKETRGDISLDYPLKKTIIMSFVYILATLILSPVIIVLFACIRSWIGGGLFVAVLAGMFIKPGLPAAAVAAAWMLFLNTIWGKDINQEPLQVIGAMMTAAIISYTVNFIMTKNNENKVSPIKQEAKGDVLTKGKGSGLNN